MAPRNKMLSLPQLSDDAPLHSIGCIFYICTPHFLSEYFEVSIFKINKIYIFKYLEDHKCSDGNI